MMLIKRARMTTSMGVGRLAGIENTPAGRPARRHHSSLHVRDKAAAPRQPGLRDREDLVHEQSEKGSSAGWKVGTAAAFLSLNEQEGAFVEMKLVLARFDGWLNGLRSPPRGPRIVGAVRSFAPPQRTGALASANSRVSSTSSSALDQVTFDNAKLTRA